MSTPVDPRTVAFDILARHESAEAANVLMQALACDDSEARRLAAVSVVKRRGQQSLLEIIRHVDSLDDVACEEFSRSPGRFRVALQQAILRSDDATRDAAFEFIRRTANFEQFPTLLNQLESTDAALREIVGVAIGDLATRMSQRLRTGDESILPGLNASTLRMHRSVMLGELDARTQRLSGSDNLEPVLRSLLTLGSPNDVAIKSVFTRHGTSCQKAAIKLLSEDSHPSLFDLMGDFLLYHAPPVPVIDVIRTRNDLGFIQHLLTQMPKQPSGVLKSNLAKLHNLSWLQGTTAIIEQLPPAVHDRLVTVINHAPLDEELRTRLKTWVIRQSGAVGREAASDMLNSLPAETTSQILHEALVDKNPEVEAWATHRLRAQKLPGTFHELLKRLDRNVDVVRNAARDELSSFDLNYLLKNFGDLSPEQSRQCGQTLLKINPNAPAELIGEITHPFRRRKIRAIQAAEAIGLVDEVLPGLLEALTDSEVSVRCAVVEVLGRNPSRESIEAIHRMTGDENRFVRSAAEDALTNLSNRLTTVRSEFVTPS